MGTQFVLGAAVTDNAVFERGETRESVWHTWSATPPGFHRTIRASETKHKKKQSFIRFEPYRESRLTAANLHDRRSWTKEFRAIIELRNSVFRKEVGGRKLKFCSLEDQSDIGAFFILAWQGSTLVFAFKLAPIFETWSGGRWSPSEDTASLQRGATLSRMQGKGFYGMGLPLMAYAADYAGYKKLAVMLAANLDKEAPKLLRLFRRMGFKRLNVQEISSGPLSDVEKSRNVFMTTCGLYDEPIALAPYEAPLPSGELRSAIFQEYVDRAAGNHFVISAMLEQISILAQGNVSH